MIDRFLGETESYREKYCLIVFLKGFCKKRSTIWGRRRNSSLNKKKKKHPELLWISLFILHCKFSLLCVWSAKNLKLQSECAPRRSRIFCMSGLKLDSSKKMLKNTEIQRSVCLWKFPVIAGLWSLCGKIINVKNLVSQNWHVEYNVAALVLKTWGLKFMQK